MTTYVNPFTGQTVSPSQVGYISLSISTDTALQWPVNGDDTIDLAANILEVTATASNLKLILPPANEVSVGQAVIIRNIGSNPFTVTNNSGVTVISISSGIAKYIYLTNNSTVDGTWTNIQFGSGTSSADAASLAGYGLSAINTTLNQQYATQTYSANSTLSANNRAAFAVWTGGAGTITLPPSSIGNGWFCMIANDGTGILNIVPQGTDTIDGLSSRQLQLTESFVIVCNGSGFNTFGYGQATVFAFTQLSLVVTGGTYTLSTSQASNIIQEYSGTLTSNQIVILPPTVQLYSLSNTTSGAFSLTFKTTAVGGSTLTLASGQTIIAICDGTNVYNSQTAATSSASSLTLGNGAAANPSLNFTGDTSTGVYLAASGTLGFSAAGVLGMQLSSTGLQITNGIGGGTF
jgi:hypothetical protein